MEFYKGWGDRFKINLSKQLHDVLVHTSPNFMGKFCFISEDSGSFEQLKGNIALINDHSSGILVHGVYSRHNLKKIQDAASIFLDPPRLFLIH